MRIFTSIITAAVAVLGSPAWAIAQQAPTRTVLIGTWVRTVPWKIDNSKEIDTLVFHADSTWEMYVDVQVGDTLKHMMGNTGCSGWTLSGDSLWFFGPPAAPIMIHGKRVVVGELPVHATLRGQELTLRVTDPRGKTPTIYEKVYQRFGDARPRKGSCR